MKTDFAKGAAWAIVPERFDELVRQVHEATITDDLILKAEKEGALVLGFSQDQDAEKYEITEDGAAIIKIAGPLMKDAGFFGRLFGFSDYNGIQAAVKAAVDDQRVNGIILDVDSPGGTVNGADETAEMIFNARGQKPIVAFSSGMMASAAYLIGSAADKIVVGKNAEVGSIGVLMIHRDFSKAEERFGVKTTYLKAGKFKAIGNPSEPLSDDARAVFQEELNHIYGNFIETVSLHRDTEAEKVRSDMADGRIFLGVQAVGAGLADEVGNLQTALVYASSDETSTRRIDSMKPEIKSIEDLRALAPALLQEAENRAMEIGASTVDMGPVKKEAADAERARILGLAKVHFGEDDGAKFESLINSNMTVEQYQAAVAAIGKPEAKKDTQAEALAALKASGAENPGSGNPGESGKGYMELVEEYRAMHKCSKTDAMMAVNRTNPKARQEYLEKVNPGLTVAK